MDALVITGTGETPNVVLDVLNNNFEISGKSLPEDVKEFYNPILRWFKTYSETPNDKTTLKMKMDYFNTASSKMILELFELLDEMHGSGKSVEVEWYYQEDDEDMMDAGTDYADMLEFPFNLFSYQTLPK
ncbi:MAG: DUF1987 domain-containing protein [Bacteroidales bacterium]|nr:DUF1987 domain-containing protein [Bacteroidales bacterium]HPD95415.1 DUF1987 domain-containing protein [Tenuifilaceae bacterium]